MLSLMRRISPIITAFTYATKLTTGRRDPNGPPRLDTPLKPSISELTAIATGWIPAFSIRQDAEWALALRLGERDINGVVHVISDAILTGEASWHIKSSSLSDASIRNAGLHTASTLVAVHPRLAQRLMEPTEYVAFSEEPFSPDDQSRYVRRFAFKYTLPALVKADPALATLDLFLKTISIANSDETHNIVRAHALSFAAQLIWINKDLAVQLPYSLDATLSNHDYFGIQKGLSECLAAARRVLKRDISILPLPLSPMN